MIFVQLLVMLLVILIAAEVFTNALEHLGEKLGISEGVTGSIFAAVGTALPETLVPLLAIFTYTSSTANVNAGHEIGVGAILGAPLMLATLSLALMAISVWKRRGTVGHLRPERTGLTRDLNFFIVAFAFAAIAMVIPHTQAVIRYGIGFLMVMIYFVYVLMTIRASKALVEDGHATEADSDMFLCKLGLPNNMAVIVLQLLLGLGLLIFGAKGFINQVEGVAAIVGISALLLSLLIIPIATELPEKVNSILWIRKGKDTLAFGNITGAMVFQGTLLPAIGIMLTPWEAKPEVAWGIAITLIAAIWLRFLVAKGDLRVWHLLVNGVLYVTYLAIVLL
jgi:cation:H+ antiporter